MLKEVNQRFGKGSIMKLGGTSTKVYAAAPRSALPCATSGGCTDNFILNKEDALGH